MLFVGNRETEHFNNEPDGGREEPISLSHTLV